MSATRYPHSPVRCSPFHSKSPRSGCSTRRTHWSAQEISDLPAHSTESSARSAYADDSHLHLPCRSSLPPKLKTGASSSFHPQKYTAPGNSCLPETQFLREFRKSDWRLTSNRPHSSSHC